jgi:uroporphyrin-III C-methyltransferase
VGATPIGKVYLVGAGPGDPELITLKGMRCLEAADVILYDDLVNGELLGHALDAEAIYVGKRAGQHCADQRAIEELLIQHARQGKMVVRLKGGDPFVFGRGGEEAGALKRVGIPYEIVPGISSAIAAPAYAGIPITQRGYASSAAIVTGHQVSKVKWRELLLAVDTIVILMGGRNLRAIMRGMIENGCDPGKPVALIQSGTNLTQKKLDGTVATIVELAQEWKFHEPTVIIVGAVVRLGTDLEWFHENICGQRSSHWQDGEDVNNDLQPCVGHWPDSRIIA